MDLRNIKVGVFGGGVSAERDISLLSANQVYRALVECSPNTVLIEINSCQPEEVKRLISAYSLDVAFLALHGAFGEDGGIQGILENLNIAYTGSNPLSSSLAMNKATSKQKFKAVGIPTPEFHFCHDKDRIPNDLTYPLVVKPCSSGSSLGVSIVGGQQELGRAVDAAFAHQDIILFEDYIPGRELTVGILDNQPLAVVEIIPKRGYYDFKAKYSDGLTEFIAPAKISKSIYQNLQALGLSAHQALGCEHFSRVDLRLDQAGQPYVLEVNSIPGFTSHSLLPLSAAACGIEFTELVSTMVKLALNRAAAMTRRG